MNMCSARWKKKCAWPYLTGIVGVGEMFRFGPSMLLLAGRTFTSIVTRVTIHFVENMDDRVGQAVARPILRPRGGFLCFALDEEARDRTPHSTKSQHPRRWQRRSVRTGPCPRHSRRERIQIRSLRSCRGHAQGGWSLCQGVIEHAYETVPIGNAKVRPTEHRRISRKSKVRIRERTNGDR